MNSADVAVTQQTLTFSRGDKFALLRSAEFGESQANSRLLRSLIEQLELCGHRDGCHPYMQTLADRMGYSIRTVRRTVALAKRLGVVAVEAKMTRGQTANEYFVQWERVKELGRVAPGQTGRGAGQTSRPPPVWEGSPEGLDPLVDPLIDPPPPIPPKPNANGDTAASGDTAGWGKAAAELSDLGMATAADTVDEAKLNGFTPSDLLQVKHTYEANRKLFRGPGAIAFYIRNRQWPAEGVRQPEEVRRIRRAKEQRARAEKRERERYAFIQAARKAGKPSDWIDAEATRRYGSDTL